MMKSWDGFAGWEVQGVIYIKSTYDVNYNYLIP